MTRIPLKNVIFVGHRETGGAALFLLPEYGVVEMVRPLTDGTTRTFWFPLRECQQLEPMAVAPSDGNGGNPLAVDATAKNEINVEPTGSTGAPVVGRVRGPRAK